MKKELFKGSIFLNPVPAVIITSKNREGKVNAFTVAWIGTVCTNPPMLSISIRPERLSYEYIKETMEFTVNIPNKYQVREVDYCGVVSGRKINKIEQLNLKIENGYHISAPFLVDLPINIECKVKTIIPLGTHDLFIAEIQGTHIDKSLIDEKGKIHFEEANLISYSHGEYFPVEKMAIGQFGFSISKNKIINEKFKHIKFYEEYRKDKKKRKKILKKHKK